MTDSSELLNEIYEAALAPERWPSALAALGRAFSGSVVMLQAYDVALPSAQVVEVHGMESCWIARYGAHYGRLNPWFQAAPDKVAAGTVRVGEEVLSTSELERTEFYADFMRPQRVSHTMNAVLRADGAVSANLSLVRGAAYSDDERATLMRLVPHLQRALRVHRLVRGQRSTIDGLMGALDRDQTAALVVDRQGRLLLTNETARALLAENDGLYVKRGGEVGFASTDVAAALRRALRARVAASANDSDADTPLVIERPSGRAALGLLVTSLSPGQDRDERYLLLVRDPTRGGPMPQRLVELFGLTPAEAAVVVRLAAGRATREIAEQLGVRYETVRTHLKHAMAKCNAARQAELVRVVMRSVAALAPSEPR